MDKDIFIAGLIFVGMYFFVIVLPCALIALIGYRMITKLGNMPSKTPAIQLTIFWKLVAIEIVALILLLTIYHMLVDYSKDKFAPGASLRQVIQVRFV